MITVELKNIQKETSGLAEFLRSKLKGPIRAHGRSQLLLEGASDKETKLLMHKFLHHKGLDDYRVEVVHPGLLEIFPPKASGPRPSKESGTPPPASVTMPYYFPGTGIEHMPAVKKTRTKR